jgi:hypothetical protein
LVLGYKKQLTNKEERYLAFFESVAKHNNNTKIALTSFLISEIVNRYLRDISMKKFAAKNAVQQIDSSYFKMVYRQDAQYAIDYELLCDDIKSYHNSFVFVSDEFDSFKARDILKSPPKNLDFNDYLAVKLATKNKAVIITDDKDFWVEDVIVITQNFDLLQKMVQLNIVPKV